MKEYVPITASNCIKPQRLVFDLADIPDPALNSLGWQMS